MHNKCKEPAAEALYQRLVMVASSQMARVQDEVSGLVMESQPPVQSWTGTNRNAGEGGKKAANHQASGHRVCLADRAGETTETARDGRAPGRELGETSQQLVGLASL